MTHEVVLQGYNVKPGSLQLGTFDSYGIEELHVTADDSWDGLDILAVFHAPNGTAKKVVVGADGMLAVPPEATAKQAGVGRIVFVGLAENVQRITVDMGYNIKPHSDIEGDNPGTPTPDVVQQILANSNNAVSIATAAQDAAENARQAAEDAAKKAGEGAGGAAASAAAAKKSAEDAAASSKSAASKAEESASSASAAAKNAKAAQTAQGSAENAAQTAADAAGAARQAAGVAGSAAKASSTSAGEAAQSAEAAETAKQRAEDAAKKALEAKTGSENALQDADAAKDAASGYADAAAEKATAASKSENSAADSAAAAKKSADDANNTANSIKDSMTQISENKEAVSQLKEDIESTNSILEENLVRISANLINPDNMLENTAITISNRISTSSNTTYKSYLNIPVKAGESYYIGNSHRVSCVIDSAENKLVLQSNTQNKTGPFIFNVEKSGLLCVCFYMTEEKPWVALAEKETEYEEYGSKLLQEWLKLQIEKYGYSNPLKGKTIYNFGDSISNGQGNLVGDKRLGPAELVALDNDMVCTDFAVSGSTMSTAGGGNYTLKRINDAISASPITPDFVLLAGGINDLKVTSVGDFSEPSSNDDFGEEYIGLLDTSNFSGAFETAIYRILNAWPGAQLIYMTEHKMPSHYNDGTETLYQTAEKICKKWCVPILDMWNSGGLNMSVLANNKAYGTGDANLDGIHTDTTHPNGEAYRLYYVPKLKSKLLECCPKTN
jgi:hypothetical protein|nr:MAG TPA: GDSL like Lipase Acylhydrolase [Caudoviricetes sp.]